MEQLLQLCKDLGIRIAEAANLPGEGCYVPNQDIIYLNQFCCWVTKTCPINVLAHEIGHWTGRSNRLNRFDFTGKSKDQDVEELTASYFGIMLLDSLNIQSQDNEDVLSRIEATDLQHQTAKNQAMEAMSYFETLIIGTKVA